MKKLSIIIGLFLIGWLLSQLSINNVKRANFGIFQVNGPTPIANCPDSVPSPATTYGFTTCNFASIFPNLNRVDINNANTSTTTTDWWVSNLYQNFVVPTGNFSISGGNAMKISRGAGSTNADNSPSLQSIYFPFPYSQSFAYHGRTFKNGFLWRTTWAFDETKSNNTNATSFPAIWSDCAVGTDRMNYVEADALESFTGNMNVENVFFKHAWVNTVDFSTQFNISPRSEQGNPVLNESTFHTLDLLWVPAAKNSGTGLYYTYFDDNFLSTQSLQYTSNGNAVLGTGGMTPNNFAGAFYACDNAAGINPNGFALYFTVGHSGTNASPTDWPMLFQNSQIWQTSNGDMIVNYLMQQDIGMPIAANDNKPMWLNKVA